MAVAGWLPDELHAEGLWDAGRRRRRTHRAVEEGLAPHALDVLAAPTLGDLEAGESDDVVPGVLPGPSGRIPDRNGDRDLVVDVVVAVRAHLVAGQAADAVGAAGQPDLGAAPVGVRRWPDLAVQEWPIVAAAARIGRRVLPEAIAATAELQPAEAARDVEIAWRQMLRIAGVGRIAADVPRAEGIRLEEGERDARREQRSRRWSGGRVAALRGGGGGRVPLAHPEHRQEERAPRAAGLDLHARDPSRDRAVTHVGEQRAR